MKRRPKPPLPDHARVALALALALLLALALGLRVVHLADVARSPFFARPMIDGQAYDTWAQAIRAGTAPARPFYQDPLYPYLLALLYAVFGHQYLAVYILQLLLGLAVTALIFDTARRLFDFRAGVAAGFFAAVYPVFIFYEGMVEKTALAVFLLALTLWATIRSLRPGRWPWPLLAGAALGLAALVRANLLAFAPLLVLALALRGTPRLRSALLAAAAVLAVIAPVAIRNSLLAREPVLTTTQAGQNFYIGNGPHNRTGQYEAPPWVRANPAFEETDARAWAEQQAGGPLSYGGVSRLYFRRAFEWFAAKPGDFLRLLARKTLLFVNRTEVPDNQDIAFFARYSRVLRLPLPGFAAIFCLGLAGIILFFRRGAAHATLALFFGLYAASVIAFFVLARYRLPAVTALLPFAGGMVAWFLDHWRTRRYRRAAAGFGLVLACLAVTLVPLRRADRRAEDAQCLANLAATYYHEGDTAAAIRTWREALAIGPGQSEAARNLGIILLGRGELDEASRLFEQSTRSNPDNPDNWYYHGMTLERRGLLADALAAYQRAAGLNPAEPRYAFGAATILQKQGRYAEALATYDRLLAEAPDNPLVHHNRAVALHNLGRYPEAAAELAETRRLGGPVNPAFEQQLRQHFP